MCDSNWLPLTISIDRSTANNNNNIVEILEGVTRLLIHFSRFNARSRSDELDVVIKYHLALLGGDATDPYRSFL